MIDTPQAQAEHISEVLHGHRVANGWRAHCPAHDDEHPSLDITVKSGKVLVICRTGCDNAAVIEALRERGLWERRSEEEPQVRDSGKPSGRYQYTASDGTVLWKERFDHPPGHKPAKSFVWYGPDGSKALNGHKPLPYRSERIAELPASDPVLIVEGEKCVRACERLGFAAICGPNGTASKPDDSWAEIVRGHPVWLICDNDDPGRKHMDEVRAIFTGAGIPCVTVQIPGLPVKGDIADWIAAGGTRGKLEELAEQAKEAGSKDQTKAVLVYIRSMAEVVERPIDWLWKPNIAIGKPTLVDGDPGNGKSWFTLGITATVTRGGRFPGEDGDRREPGRVLLVAGEDDLEDTVKPRLRMAGADQDLVRPVTGIIRPGETDSCGLTLDDEGLAALAEQIRDYRPALVIIDPLLEYLPGVDVNKAQEVRRALRPIRDMAKALHVAMLCVRHLNKSVGLDAIYRGQGSMDFVAVARTGLLVAPDPEDLDRYVAVPYKSNLVKKGDAVTFRLPSLETGGRFLWEGTMEVGANGLINPGESGETRSSLEEAKSFLIEFLRDGPIPAKEITTEARHSGVSEITLRRARQMLGVRIEREGASGRRGLARFLWSLPPLDDHPTIPPMSNLIEQVNQGSIFGEKEPNLEGGPDLLAHPTGSGGNEQVTPDEQVSQEEGYTF